MHLLGIHPKKINASNDLQELRNLTSKHSIKITKPAIVKITRSEKLAEVHLSNYS